MTKIWRHGENVEEKEEKKKEIEIERRKEEESKKIKSWEMIVTLRSSYTEQLSRLLLTF